MNFAPLRTNKSSNINHHQSDLRDSRYPRAVCESGCICSESWVEQIALGSAEDGMACSN